MLKNFLAYQTDALIVSVPDACDNNFGVLCACANNCLTYVPSMLTV